jgi:hypothetical protein
MPSLHINVITHIVLLQRSSVLWTVYFVLLGVVQQQQHDDVSLKNGGNCSGAAEIAAIIQRKLCEVWPQLRAAAQTILIGVR